MSRRRARIDPVLLADEERINRAADPRQRPRDSRYLFTIRLPLGEWTDAELELAERAFAKRLERQVADGNHAGARNTCIRFSLVRAEIDRRDV